MKRDSDVTGRPSDRPLSARRLHRSAKITSPLISSVSCRSCVERQSVERRSAPLGGKLQDFPFSAALIDPELTSRFWYLVGGIATEPRRSQVESLAERCDTRRPFSGSTLLLFPVGMRASIDVAR